MNRRAEVSIIVPVYNVEKYLPECLESVLSQTFTNFEVICINDGSPDKCGNTLEKYARKDKRIKLITQENQGLSMARNKGLEIATGKYILFLDSDDVIHPQLLEICHSLAEQTNATMVSFSFHKFIDHLPHFIPKYHIHQIPYKITTTPLYYQTKRHKWKIHVNTWAKLYRKDFIQQFRFIPHITMEDYPHTYEVLNKNPQTVILALPLYFYRRHPTSITNANLSIQKIQDYHVGLEYIRQIYQHQKPKEWKFIRYHLFPNILKQQLNKIKKAPIEKQADLLSAFAIELDDLDKKGCLKLRGNKLTRWLFYKHLIQRKK